MDSIQNPDSDLLNHIKKLSKIKHSLDALKTGTYKNETIQLEHLCYSMRSENQTVFVLLNQSSDVREIGFNTGFSGFLTDVLNDNRKYGCDNYVNIQAQPKSSMILVANDGNFSIDFTEQKVEKNTAENTVKIENKPECEKLEKQEITLGKYRHFKGNEYEVVGFAKDSETTEKVVIYKALYGEEELWVRPYEMFREIIERDGKEIRRFTKID